jgi:hypothetical protein
LTVHPVFEPFDVAATSQLEFLLLHLAQTVASIDHCHSPCQNVIQSSPQGRRRDRSIISQDQLIEFLHKTSRRVIKRGDLRRWIVWPDFRLGRLSGQETGGR